MSEHVGSDVEVRVTVNLPRQAAVRLKEISEMYRRSMADHGGIMIMLALGFPVEFMLAPPDGKKT